MWTFASYIGSPYSSTTCPFNVVVVCFTSTSLFEVYTLFLFLKLVENV